MKKQIIICYATEGNTDVPLLESIIKRTFEEIAIECTEMIEIFDPIFLKKVTGEIAEKALKYATQARERGAMILCFHVDADSKTDEDAFKYQIKPAFDTIRENHQDLCLVALVPIQMSEAWMLADKELLKKELGTNKNDEELGIHKKPEDYANPKTIIQEAIRISRQQETKRRRGKLTIDELYQPMGQKIALEKLNKLSSYRKFKEEVKKTFRNLKYLP